MSLTQAIEIFISYSDSREDEELREKLVAHLSALQRKGLISAWHAREISAGTERESEILKRLNSAHIILLLVSADFISSEYCYGVELERAMERHRTGEACVIPILLRYCDWEGTLFSHLQPLPRDGKPILGRPAEEKDLAFTEVAREIRRIVNDMTTVQHQIELFSNASTATQKQKKALQLDWQSIRLVILLSILFGVLIIGLRIKGALQVQELRAYDQLMSLRLNLVDEKPDPRLLIVGITDADVEAYSKEYKGKAQDRGEGLLPDDTVVQLLEKLKRNNAKVIGLDIHRDFKANRTLAPLLKNNNKIIAVCKLGETDKQGKTINVGIQAPPEIQQAERLGFSDLVTDEDGIVRRHLLKQKQDEKYCRTGDAFGFALARAFLVEQGQQYTNPYNAKGEFVGNLRFGNTPIQPMDLFSGGYQTQEEALESYQILLNYRATKNNLRQVAAIQTLTQILKDNSNETNKNLIEGNLVLIGYDSRSGYQGDEWHTPYQQGDNKIPGVIIQAHAVSQLLSAVLDRRSLIWWWSVGLESVWIWIWALMGGILAVCYRKGLWLAIAILAAMLVLYFICCITFIVGSGWIPLIPPIFALLATALGVGVLRAKGIIKRVRLS